MLKAPKTLLDKIRQLEGLKSKAAERFNRRDKNLWNLLNAEREANDWARPYGPYMRWQSVEDAERLRKQGLDLSNRLNNRSYRMLDDAEDLMLNGNTEETRISPYTARRYLFDRKGRLLGDIPDGDVPRLPYARQYLYDAFERMPPDERYEQTMDLLNYVNKDDPYILDELNRYF